MITRAGGVFVVWAGRAGPGGQPRAGGLVLQEEEHLPPVDAGAGSVRHGLHPRHRRNLQHAASQSQVSKQIKYMQRFLTYRHNHVLSWLILFIPQ